jgi:hypothetical protein
MDSLESLVREVGDLRRRLWAASQTWSGKLEHLFSSLLSGGCDIESLDKDAAQNLAIGHGFAVIFLLSGVTGMPPIHGKSAEEWISEWKAANPGSWHDQVKKLNSDRSLPSSYGSDIAGPLYATAMKRVHNRRHDADDLVSDTYAKFLGRSYIRPEPVKSAISYVQKAINNLGITEGQEKGREQSLTPENKEEKALQHDIEDSSSIDEMLDEHNAQEIVQMIYKDSQLKRELEAIHPDALQYLNLNANDYEDKEILGADNPPRGGEPAVVFGPGMLEHPYSKQGVRLYPSLWSNVKARMFAVIKKRLLMQGVDEHAMVASYDYDRRSV